MKSMRHRTTFLAFAVLALAVSFGATATPMTEPIEDVVTLHAISPADQAAVEKADNASTYVINVRAQSRLDVIHLAAKDAPAPAGSDATTTVVARFDLPSTGRLPLPDNPRLFPPTPDIGIGLS